MSIYKHFENRLVLAINVFSNGCETMFLISSHTHLSLLGDLREKLRENTCILLILLAAVHPQFLPSSNEPKPLDREESHLLLSPPKEAALFRHRITLVLQQQQVVVVIVATEGTGVI